MNFDFIPDHPDLTGRITMKELGVEDRLAMGADLLADVAGVQSGDEIEKAKSSFKILSDQLALAKKNIVEVSLTNNKTKRAYASYEDLNSDSSMHPVLVDMATAYMQRIDLGNLLKARSKS